MEDQTNTAVADPPVATSPVNADGTFAEDWYKDAPEPQHEYCKRFKSLADLRESSYQTKSKLGIPHEKVLQIPEEGDSEAKWNDYYEKLGVPGSVEGYEFVREPDLTDRAQVDEKEMEAVKAVASRLHMNKDQFNGFINTVLGLRDIRSQQEGIERETKERDLHTDAQNTMKNLFGAAAEERRVRANAVLQHYGKGEVKDTVGNVTANIGQKLFDAFPGLNQSPWMVMFLDSIASDMSEDRISGFTKASVSSPTQVRDSLDKLREEPGYFDESHKDHKKVMAEKMRLMKLI